MQCKNIKGNRHKRQLEAGAGNTGHAKSVRLKREREQPKMASIRQKLPVALAADLGPGRLVELRGGVGGVCAPVWTPPLAMAEGQRGSLARPLLGGGGPKKEGPPRHGTPWSSTVNLAATAMGTGVLTLPYAFARCGPMRRAGRVPSPGFERRARLLPDGCRSRKRRALRNGTDPI